MAAASPCCDGTRGIAQEEAEIYLGESRQLLGQIGEVTARARDAGIKDSEPDDAAKLIAKTAPRLSKLTAGSLQRATEVRTAAKRAAEIVDDIFGDLDEEDCPHCGGRGSVGLVGHLCPYCGGSCFVTTNEVAEYDRSAIDEHECPSCSGRGQTGLAGDLCAYCKGACVVSKDLVRGLRLCRSARRPGSRPWPAARQCGSGQQVGYALRGRAKVPLLYAQPFRWRSLAEALVWIARLNGHRHVAHLIGRETDIARVHDEGLPPWAHHLLS